MALTGPGVELEVMAGYVLVRVIKPERLARRVQIGAFPIYPVGLSQAVHVHAMQLLPHAGPLPIAQALPAGRPRATAISFGRISQGMPLFRTKTMPARAARPGPVPLGNRIGAMR